MSLDVYSCPVAPLDQINVWRETTPHGPRPTIRTPNSWRGRWTQTRGDHQRFGKAAIVRPRAPPLDDADFERERDAEREREREREREGA